MMRVRTDSSMSQRKSFSHRAVFLALAASLVLALGVAAYVFARYVRYRPLADRHLISDPAVVVRMDVEQAVVYEPFRRHLLPLLELGRRGPKSRLERFESQTTIELGVDLREVVLETNTRGEFLIALGGHFRRDGVVRGARAMLAEEGIATAVSSSPERLVHASGVSFGVSRDGVLLLASSEALLLEALVPRPAPVKITPGAALELISPNAPADCCDPRLRGVRLLVLPGQAFPAEVLLGLSEPPRDVPDAGQVLSGKSRDFMLLGEDVQLEIESIEGASVRARARLSRGQFDAVVGRIGSDVASWFGGPKG